MSIYIYNISALRAEPATMPFLRELAAEQSYFSCFFKPVRQEALQTIVSKTNIFAVDFLDFVMSNPAKTSTKAIPNPLKIRSGAVLGVLSGEA